MGKALLTFALTAASLMAEGPIDFPARRMSPGAGRRGSTGPSITADLSLVLVPVTVTDRKGRTVTGLKPENFRVLEDGAPRSIVFFGSEDAPVSLGIILDLSGSMKHKVPAAPRLCGAGLRGGRR